MCQLFNAKGYLSHGKHEQCRLFSTRKSIFPALSSSTALAKSKVTVPVFALGIRPLGPRIFPIFPTRSHHIRCCNGLVKFQPAVFYLFNKLVISHNISTGNPRPLFPFHLWQIRRPGPLFQDHWAGRRFPAPSGLRASGQHPTGQPDRQSRQTWHMIRPKLFVSHHQSCCLLWVSMFFLDSRYFLPRFGILPHLLLFYLSNLNAHASGSAGNNFAGRIQIIGIQVHHFQLCNLFNLITGHFSHFFP